MSYERFRAAGAHEAALDLSDLFIVSLRGDDIKILIQDGTNLYQLQVKYQRENVLESMYTMRIRESCSASDRICNV